jgi:hypothetical protein
LVCYHPNMMPTPLPLPMAEFDLAYHVAADDTVTVDISFVGGNTVVSPFDPAGVVQQAGQCLEMARFFPRHNLTEDSAGVLGGVDEADAVVTWLPQDLWAQEEPPGMVLWACVSVYVSVHVWACVSVYVSVHVWACVSVHVSVSRVRARMGVCVRARTSP